MTIKIDPETARNVLWYFGDREYGWQPGSFTEKLTHAIAGADSLNRNRISLGFPALVNAVELAQDFSEGMDRLRQIATGDAGETPRACIECDEGMSEDDMWAWASTCSSCLRNAERGG